VRKLAAWVKKRDPRMLLYQQQLADEEAVHIYLTKRQTKQKRGKNREKLTAWVNPRMLLYQQQLADEEVVHIHILYQQKR
jgi:hypothetical protein